MPICGQVLIKHDKSNQAIDCTWVQCVAATSQSYMLPHTALNL